MNQEIFTKEMLRRHLRKMWAEKGFPLADDDHVGVSVHELVTHSAERNARHDLPYVDLWIGILDECISWFISLHTVVLSQTSPNNQFSDFEKTATLIVGKIIADSTAIRHLIQLGFDSSARTMLRSVSEYMELLVAIFHKPKLASEFVTSDTPEGAQQFWEQHLRGGKIRRKVKEAWVDLFQGEADGGATWFANWGRSSNQALSGIIHPSFMGGVTAAIPLKAEYRDENWAGVWGERADASVETVFIYVQFMFPILLLSTNIPFSEEQSYILRTYDETDELHRHVQIGRHILASVILSLGAYAGSKHTFPDYDMSIFGGT